MKSRDAGTTITSNDELVRQRIFDGLIPPDDYHREIADMERSQHADARAKFLLTKAALDQRVAILVAAIVAMHRAVPGGSLCDPQKIADDLRQIAASVDVDCGETT